MLQFLGKDRLHHGWQIKNKSEGFGDGVSAAMYLRQQQSAA